MAIKFACTPEYMWALNKLLDHLVIALLVKAELMYVYPPLCYIILCIVRIDHIMGGLAS